MVNTLLVSVLGTKNSFLPAATAGVKIKAYLKPGGNQEEQREIKSVLQFIALAFTRSSPSLTTSGNPLAAYLRK